MPKARQARLLPRYEQLALFQRRSRHGHSLAAALDAFADRHAALRSHDQNNDPCDLCLAIGVVMSTPQAHWAVHSICLMYSNGCASRSSVDARGSKSTVHLGRSNEAIAMLVWLEVMGAVFALETWSEVCGCVGPRWLGIIAWETLTTCERWRRRWSTCRSACESTTCSPCPPQTPGTPACWLPSFASLLPTASGASASQRWSVKS